MATVQQRVEAYMRQHGPVICEKCKKPCQLLMPQSRPEAAEFYCEKCHKSYPVVGEEK